MRLSVNPIHDVVMSSSPAVTGEEVAGGNHCSEECTGNAFSGVARDDASFDAMMVDVERLIKESRLKFTLARASQDPSPRKGSMAVSILGCPEERECDALVGVPKYFSIRVPAATGRKSGFVRRLKVAVRCLSKDCRIWAYGSVSRVLVWTWTGQSGEGVFGVSVVVKGGSPQEGRRRIAVVTRVDEVHVGITKKVREIAAGVVLDGEIQQSVAAIAADKRRRLKEARRRGGDRISENVRSNPTRTPRAKWMAQCLQTIHREMRHEQNRKRRVEMQRLDDEKAREAVDNKNAVVKSPTETPRRVADDQRRSKWEESVDSARQKTLAVVYCLVVLAKMREVLKEKRMKDTSEVERSEAALRIQRWVRTCRVGSTLRVDCGGAAEVVGGNARKIKSARIVGLLQKRWRGVLARRRARVEVLRRRIERMAVFEEEQVRPSAARGSASL
ncbi:hypothetical protein FOZ62_025606 [Perkinsus olseni]|uniref:Uncharacterized protein n=1 Tax=Perkinsus olseni TaxID=32597 RepID=A0A7J6UFV3_PEROL|nr:hypothetical protein FOZ62_025606 [Perkinsus olseni]